MRAAWVLAVAAAWPTTAWAQDDAALARARALLRRVIRGRRAQRPSLGDPRDTEGPDDVARLRPAQAARPATPTWRGCAQGGIGAQFWSVYVPAEIRPEDYVRHTARADRHRAARDRALSRALELALSTAPTCERAMRSGKIASLLGVEGGPRDRELAGRRCARTTTSASRYMTLTHNVTLDWADAASFASARHGGLTRFGEEVVREMNRLGMLVDLSHVSPDTMDDALRVSEAPVIFSHSSARALVDRSHATCPMPILKRLPTERRRRDGDVRDRLHLAGDTREPRTPLWQEYAEADRGRWRTRSSASVSRSEVSRPPPKVAGDDRAGRRPRRARPQGRRTSTTSASAATTTATIRWPQGLEDVSKYPHLFAELARRGWSDADLEKLAGDNLLRVLRPGRSGGRPPAGDAPAVDRDDRTARRPGQVSRLFSLP